MKLERGPGSAVPVLHSNGLDPVKVATLAAILAGQDPDETDPDDLPLPDEVHAGGEDGPWVYRLSDDVLRRLADGTDHAAAARRWQETEEWQAEGWPEEVYFRWFGSLVQLARTARGAGRSLFLWMSL